MSIEITNISFFLNTALRIITAILFLVFLIPLLLKEARVQNGLKVLRVELLLTGSIIFLVNTIGLLIIVADFMKLDTAVVSNFVVSFNSIGFLAYALMKIRIYRQHYSQASKKLHEEFAKFESEQSH